MSPTAKRHRLTDPKLKVPRYAFLTSNAGSFVGRLEKDKKPSAVAKSPRGKYLDREGVIVGIIGTYSVQ
jgi:hypothetical protein